MINYIWHLWYNVFPLLLNSMLVLLFLFIEIFIMVPDVVSIEQCEAKQYKQERFLWTVKKLKPNIFKTRYHDYIINLIFMYQIYFRKFVPNPLTKRKLKRKVGTPTSLDHSLVKLQRHEDLCISSQIDLFYIWLASKWLKDIPFRGWLCTRF